MAVSHLRGLRLVPRPELVSGIYDSLEREGFVALCSDAGMGKRCLAQQVADKFRSEGAVVDRFRFSHNVLSSYKRLRKACSLGCEKVESGSRVLIVVDTIPEVPEPYIDRLSQVLEAVVTGGCKLLVLMAPEAEVSLEGFSHPRVYYARDMSIPKRNMAGWAEYLSGWSASRAYALTKGIPELVVSLRGLSFSEFDEPVGDSWHATAAAHIVRALRSGYMYEELALRFAMVALGTGSVSDFETLGIRVSRDILSDIARCDPMFGLTAHLDSFSCIPCSPELVGGMLGHVVGVSDALFLGVLKVLGKRGELRRAGLLAQGYPGSLDVDFVLRYSSELIDSGLGSLVIDAMRQELDECNAGLRALTSTQRSTREGISRLLALTGFQDVSRSKGRVENSGEGCPSGSHGGSGVSSDEVGVQVCLLYGLEAIRSHGNKARGLHGDEFGRLLAYSRESTNAMTWALGCHLSYLMGALGGNLADAYKDLLRAKDMHAARGNAPSIAQALVVYDLEVARMLMGDAADRKSAGDMKWAEAVSRECAPQALQDELACRVDMARYVTGGVFEDEGAAGNLAIRLSDSGANALASLAHLAVAFSYAEGASPRGALVRGRESLRVADACGLDDVACAARLLMRTVAQGEGVANPTSEGLGEVSAASEGLAQEAPRAADEAKAVRAEDMRLLEHACATLGGGDETAAGRATALLEGRMPRVEAKVLAALMYRVDRRHGGELFALMPGAWRSHASMDEVVRCRRKSPQDSMRTGLAQTEGEHAPSDSLALSIQVLGGLTVCVGGVPIPEEAWHRSHTRALLSLLALTPNHAVARYELMDLFWPGASYDRGRENLYVVLSALRKTLGQKRGGTLYVMGTGGNLWLNRDLVSCDIDRFEQVARMVVAGGVDDERALELCLELAEMYGGGTVLFPEDMSGIFFQRHKETSRKYVDALLAGFEAAMRLMRPHQALWLAQAAYAEDPGRRDARRALSQARAQQEGAGGAGGSRRHHAS